MGVHVGVEEGRDEAHQGRLKRVIAGQRDAQAEEAALVGGARRPHDGRLPLEAVVLRWAGAAEGRRLAPDLAELLGGWDMNVREEKTEGLPSGSASPPSPCSCRGGLKVGASVRDSEQEADTEGGR